jgi:hypothetical protein
VARARHTKQVRRIANDLCGSAGDTTQATDRLLWAVNAFGQVLAEVRFGVCVCVCVSVCVSERFEGGGGC